MPEWDEARRSAALHSYNLLDTPREEDFDDLAQMAAQVCDAPIAVVNLVDTDRQFFKAEVGLGVRETPLDTSFCAKAILAEDMMIVPDATKDPRFACNPLVVDEPKLRFYAGALLKSPEGLPLGTVCVLDTVPRDLDDHQVATLRLLARQASTQMELRRTLAAQQAALEQARKAERDQAIFARLAEQSSDFVGMVDTRGRPFFLNDAARELVGLTGADDIRKIKFIDYFAENDRQTVLDEALPAVARDGYWEAEIGFRSFATGETIPVLCTVFPLRGAHDDLVGYGTVTKDITARKKEQQRRADITHEISHRMKNTLAIVQAIVTQTFRTAKSIDEGMSAISGRLKALAGAQDILTAKDRTLARIGDVVDTALAPHRTGQGRFAISGPDLELTASQALGLSLAIHELATNATKHGALSGTDGGVTISWTASGDDFHFEWTEAGGPAVSAPAQRGFGSRLVERMVAPYFDGAAKLDFDTGGVSFRLDGNLAANSEIIAPGGQS